MTAHEKLIIEIHDLKANLAITMRSLDEQWDEIKNIQDEDERFEEKRKLLKKQDALMEIIQRVRRMIRDYNE